MIEDIGFSEGVMYRNLAYRERLPETILPLNYLGRTFFVAPVNGDGSGGDVFLELYDADNCPFQVRVIGKHRKDILGKVDSHTGRTN